MVTANLLPPSRISFRFLCCWGTREAEVPFDKRQVDLMVLISCNKSCPNQEKTWVAFSSGSVNGLFLHCMSFLVFWYSNSPALVVPVLFVASSLCCLLQHQDPSTKSHQWIVCSSYKETAVKVLLLFFNISLFLSFFSKSSLCIRWLGLGKLSLKGSVQVDMEFFPKGYPFF